MRTLYVPIHDPSYSERSNKHKHGLRTAFSRIGECLEWDYLTNDPATAFQGLINRAESFQPDTIFLQLGSTEHFNAAQLAQFRDEYPSIRVSNYNGDVWPDVLLAQPMIELLRHVDVQLVVNASVLPAYQALGVRAAFWPFGYETPLTPLPDTPAWDVVYMGNNYSPERAKLYEVLRSLDCSVGIYGVGWPESEGECNYDFTTGEALYMRAKLTVSDNHFDAKGYLSNRPFQAMAAGCCVLQQYVPELQRWTGFMPGTHYVPFHELGDLPSAIAWYLENNLTRCKIASAGQAYVLAHHTFDRRVRELCELLGISEGTNVRVS